MKRLNVIQTENGWLVVCGKADAFTCLLDAAPVSHSFNSLDKAIAHIRKVIKSWHDTQADHSDKGEVNP